MKKYLLLALLVCFATAFSQEKPAVRKSRFFEMSNMEIDSLLTVVSRQNLTITERIAFYSERFLGMPYNLTRSGDGPYALYEPEPLVNFRQTNCMVYCEHVLALSISDSWDNFFNNLQQIRYKDGIIGMRTRNHYTMTDWMPENRWLLTDVTKKVGGDLCISLTRTISHRKFFEGKGIKDMRYVLPDRAQTLDVVPKQSLLDIEKNTKSGDILSLIMANKTDIFSAHMLMIVEKDGQKFIRESSNSKMTTFDTPYKEWVANLQSKERYLGLCFMRINEDLNTPGRIILPWEIAELKAGKAKN